MNSDRSRHYSDEEPNGTYIYSSSGWTQIDPIRRSGIGCWVLIVIILIVLFFGNTGDKNLQRDVERLQILIEEQKSLIMSQSSEIAVLKSKVDDLTDEVKKLQQSISPKNN